MNKNLKLSVVMPAYNESTNLKSGVLDQVEIYLKDKEYFHELILVDDGSLDDTANIIEEQIKNKKKFRLIKNPHGGKAVTVMTGILQAAGDVILFTDLDQSSPIDQIEKFFPKFDQGFDVVIGTRVGRKGAPIVRKIAAWGFSILRNIIIGLPFKDTQCGFKAFSKEAAQNVFPSLLEKWKGNRVSGAAVNAGFDIETLFMSKKKGFKIAEVPVDWHHVGTERVQLIKDSIEAIKDMIRIRINDLKGRYE